MRSQRWSTGPLDELHVAHGVVRVVASAEAGRPAADLLREALGEDTPDVGRVQLERLGLDEEVEARAPLMVG